MVPSSSLPYFMLYFKEGLGKEGDEVGRSVPCSADSKAGKTVWMLAYGQKARVPSGLGRKFMLAVWQSRKQRAGCVSVV